MKKIKNCKGFTLLELLVVVLIIGILAGIALPQYRKAKDKAKYATIQPIVKAVGDAMERYYMIHNTYPVRLSALDISLESTDIRDYGSHDRILFDWGFCYFGWYNQFTCDLTKEQVAFSYFPDTRQMRCYAMSYDYDKNSSPYKFCANLPNAKLVSQGNCIWEINDVHCFGFSL